MWYFPYREAQIRSRHRYGGGGKILTFRQIHNAIITLSAPEGGQTPLTPLSTSMGGHGRICSPLDPPLMMMMMKISNIRGMTATILDIAIASFAPRWSTSISVIFFHVYREL